MENERLAKLEQKVDGVIERLDKIIDDHENRIRELEKQPAKSWNGAKTVLIASIITGIVGIIIGALSKLIG